MGSGWAQVTGPASAGAEAGRARPLRADARRNRERLLAAAEEVLADEGLAAPIDTIARRAGVGVGTVYRHFPTKEALLEAIVVQRFQRLAGETRAMVDAPDPGAAFFGFLTRVLEEAAAKKAFAEPLASSGVDLEAATSHVGKELMEVMGTLLARAQESGAVRDDLTPDDLLALLVGATHIAEHTTRNPTTRSRALTVVFDGLRPQPPD